MERCLALWTEPLPEPSTCSDAASPPSPVRRLLPSFLFVSFFSFFTARPHVCVIAQLNTVCCLSSNGLTLESLASPHLLVWSLGVFWLITSSALQQMNTECRSIVCVCSARLCMCACMCVCGKEGERERARQTAVSRTQIWIQIKMISAGICREMQTGTDWSLKNIQGAERRWEKMRESGLSLAVLHLTDAPMKCY